MNEEKRISLWRRWLGFRLWWHTEEGDTVKKVLKMGFWAVIISGLIYVGALFLKDEVESLRAFPIAITAPVGDSLMTYHTKKFVEKDSCIEFEDRWDGFVRVCGSYTIKRR